MAKIFISIGSNIDRNNQVVAGINALSEVFGELRISPVYETPAEGFDGDAFYNLVAIFESEESPTRLNSVFKQIESEHGRKRGDQKFSPRTLDIDLLLYGDQVFDNKTANIPRDEIEHYSFVLQPLADLEPEMKYPGRDATFMDMWQENIRNEAMQPGTVVKLDWDI